MNNETKQTAVEWLIDQMFKQGYFDGNKPLTFTNLDHLQQQAKEMEKEQMIDFASWLAKSEWMSIWVVDKWMWECQKENSNTNYKTDKELFDIYYEQTYGGNK
jgi:hypothetical protein